MTLRSKGGFTLIELLVVIAIIGILATIVLTSVNSVRGKAREAAVQATLRNLAIEAELYYGRNNSSYANLCNQPQIITMLDSIRDIPNGFVGCYTHAGQNLHNLSWGAAATVNGKHYGVNSEGVVKFDESNTGTSIWNNAVTACADAGKKLATLEQLRALWDLHGGEELNFSNQNWTLTEDPTNSDRAYRIRDDGSISNVDKGSSRGIRCVS